MKVAIVFTTIFDNDIVRQLCQNIEKYGHTDQTTIIVIPDKKTPPAVNETCKSFAEKGFNVLCPTVDQQDRFLEKIGLYPGFIPYNSENRRNVGYLMAMEFCDLLISIDDDNYPTDDDFVAGHTAIFENDQPVKTVSSSTKWYNPIEMLDFQVDSPGVLYPRGFPYKYRLKSEYNFQAAQTAPGQISVNAGLWLQEPDIDGITWIVQPAQSSQVSEKFGDVVLNTDTWTTINTQNTSLVREAIVAYYCLRMDFPIRGMVLARYGDIFSGFFVQKCMKALGKKLKYGNPLVIHKRNAHNYFQDIAFELGGGAMVEALIDWLMEVKLQGSSFGQLYESLSFELEEAVEKQMTGFIWTDETRAFFHYIAYLMRQWVKACGTISGTA